MEERVFVLLSWASVFFVFFCLVVTNWKRADLLAPIGGLFNCSIFCCVLLCVHSTFAIISMEKRELVACFVCLPGVS